jgi:UDP:flavonoid glycosyltransferase YjiC (YdhE family)
MGNPTKVTETTEKVVQALNEVGVRGILEPGWSGLGGDAKLPDTIAVLNSAPHNWLLPKMAAVVHHGGAGTTGSGLRSGVPSLVVPHLLDGYFWGRRVAALGAGPEPIPRKKLTSENLALAINEMVSNQAMRERAAMIGEQIQSEDGVARAIDVFHQYISW